MGCNYILLVWLVSLLLVQGWFRGREGSMSRWVLPFPPAPCVGGSGGYPIYLPLCLTWGEAFQGHHVLWASLVAFFVAQHLPCSVVAFMLVCARCRTSKMGKMYRLALVVDVQSFEIDRSTRLSLCCSGRFAGWFIELLSSIMFLR